MAEALRMSRAVHFAPLVLLVLVIAALVWRLATPGDTTVKSRMIGQLVPDLVLQSALPGKPNLPLRGGNCGPVVINFFASWCVPCIAEAKKLAELKRQGVPIVGIAVRDRPQDVGEFLAHNGDPYAAIGADPQSKAQIEFGASGVPETFVVDPHCIIRHQHIGPIEQDDVPAIRNRWEDLRK
jgi:cytochrome c biogenesis protein CcmG/thiol:disulfide interchange protein DsbE